MLVLKCKESKHNHLSKSTPKLPTKKDHSQGHKQLSLDSQKMPKESIVVKRVSFQKYYIENSSNFRKVIISPNNINNLVNSTKNHHKILNPCPSKVNDPKLMRFSNINFSISSIKAINASTLQYMNNINNKKMHEMEKEKLVQLLPKIVENTQNNQNSPNIDEKEKNINIFKTTYNKEPIIEFKEQIQDGKKEKEINNHHNYNIIKKIKTSTLVKEFLNKLKSKNINIFKTTYNKELIKEFKEQIQDGKKEKEINNHHNYNIIKTSTPIRELREQLQDTNKKEKEHNDLNITINNNKESETANINIRHSYCFPDHKSNLNKEYSKIELTKNNSLREFRSLLNKNIVTNENCKVISPEGNKIASLDTNNANKIVSPEGNKVMVPSDAKRLVLYKLSSNVLNTVGGNKDFRNENPGISNLRKSLIEKQVVKDRIRNYSKLKELIRTNKTFQVITYYIN